MESDKTGSRFCPLIARPRTARGQGTSRNAPIKSPMRGSRTFGIARPEGMGPAMTLFQPVGQTPEPSAPDRKSVVSGRGVSARVALGARSFTTKITAYRATKTPDFSTPYHHWHDNNT